MTTQPMNTLPMTPRSPLLRALVERDADAVSRLYAQSAEHLRALGCGGPFVFDAEAYRRDGFGSAPAFRGIGATVGADENAPLVGYLLYTSGYDTDRASRHLMVLDLLVDRAHRSGGLGALLMKEARRIAAGQGIDEVTLFVHVRNMRAIRFYERLGAELVEEVRWMRWAGSGPSPGAVHG
jgi:ribosomal protein S18 acetylase RimI-like enzyme